MERQQALSRVTRPAANMDAEIATRGGFSHEAVMYHQPAEYQSAVLGFVREGLARSEPALVAVPGPAARDLAASLDGRPGVEFADIARVGRNPARIIPAIWDFADRHGGTAVRLVCEPVWPGRSAAEIREAAAHEAMANLAFAAAPVRMLCPYDAGRLGAAVVASAIRTHPVLVRPDGSRDSSGYRAGPPGGSVAGLLSRPPARALAFTYSRDLRAVRAWVSRHAGLAGLASDRLTDLIIAVGEVIANTLRHTTSGGTVHIWRSGSEVICQVSDSGRIADPLVGRRRPPGPGGLGLWVVNQVCDLVELRSAAAGTTIRMHMGLPVPAADGQAPAGDQEDG